MYLKKKKEVKSQNLEKEKETNTFRTSKSNNWDCFSKNIFNFIFQNHLSREGSDRRIQLSNCQNLRVSNVKLKD